MVRSLLSFVGLTAVLLATFTSAQSSGYAGYKRSQNGSSEDVTYDTSSTSANVSVTVPDPDVYLHANVHVGEIDILVANLSAKINLDAQVLSLLQFNAGVDASIKRVFLTIQNVSAEVYLEARLGNVVTMIGDVLDSLDLNPVLATLGSDLGNITDTVGGAVGGVIGGLTGSNSSSTNDTLTRRDGGIQQSFQLAQNILYAMNNYQGNTHTNRILAQNGNIVDETLDNDGKISGQHIVGNYKENMKFTGHNHTVVRQGQTVNEEEYTYSPLPGILAWVAIYVTQAGKVIATQVLAEGFGGGESIID